jgi:uncharacterized membrane protein
MAIVGTAVLLLVSIVLTTTVTMTTITTIFGCFVSSQLLTASS